MEGQILELKHKGRFKKFVVISSLWNEEKLGFDLILTTEKNTNWRAEQKYYDAFQDSKGNTEFVKKI